MLPVKLKNSGKTESAFFDWIFVSTQDHNSPLSLFLRKSCFVLDKDSHTLQLCNIPSKKPERSLTEYLVTRAIDAPQQYVYMYAYGIDISGDPTGKLYIQALYSPMHLDHGAAARSLARVYMALIRHYTGIYDASIEVTDYPLVLDLTPWAKKISSPPILIQFCLMLTIAHITLLPSKEHGLIRHMQSHAMNFSPARYWFILYFWDLILYTMLVVLMSIVIVATLFIMVPAAAARFAFRELAVLPFMLLIYGVGCIPQAYVFSLGPRSALNSMTFIMVNVVFGETTIIAKLFYGDVYNYAIDILALSPQLNMAYALVKIKKIFLYNNECIIFQKKNLCSSKMLHKCCEKCGVLQKCFERKSFLTRTPGILMEIIATVGTAALFMTLLMLWEYRVIQVVWNYFIQKIVYRTDKHCAAEIYETEAVKRVKAEVIEKERQLKMKKREKVDTFGEYLLASNVSKKEWGVYTVRNVYFGLGRGEALALSGLKRHGRVKLCEILGGYTKATEGRLLSMSRWRSKLHPHKYARQVALSCERAPLPSWMTVYNALALLATLRGVPKKHLHKELMDYIEALGLEKIVDTRICRLGPRDEKCLHFAAAVIAAPPVIVLDECTAYQKTSTRRAMYYILYHLRKRGHAIFISSANVESHMPVTNRLAIIMNGRIYDMDQVDSVVERNSDKGYTVVVHLKDEVDVDVMFSKYFKTFTINDSSEVLVNAQVLDADLNWSQVFSKMEQLQEETSQVYCYIVTAIPIDYVYNTILAKEDGILHTQQVQTASCFKRFFPREAKIKPSQETLDSLRKFDTKFDLTSLKELPWSVIFQR